MKTRYYVVGMGYDKNDHVTDYEQYFGDFDTYEEARDLFMELLHIDRITFFNDIPNVHQLCVQLEECEEDEEESTCIDVHNEWWFINPKFCKEDEYDN